MPLVPLGPIKGDRPLAQHATWLVPLLNSNDFSLQVPIAYLTMCADLAKQQQAGATGGGLLVVGLRVVFAGGGPGGGPAGVDLRWWTRGGGPAGRQCRVERRTLTVFASMGRADEYCVISRISVTKVTCSSYNSSSGGNARLKL